MRRATSGKRRAPKISTIKKLFGLSGNQCAHPDCTNPLIVSATEESDAAVVNHVCHIYATSDRGPRGKPNLTDEERESERNLILLCGHHHSIVDNQPDTYSAKTLQRWKRDHEAKVAERMRRNPNSLPGAYTKLIEGQIEETVNRFKKRLAFLAIRKESMTRCHLPVA